MPPAATHRRPQPLPACRPPGRCCRSGRAEREGARATPLPSWRCRARGRRRSPWPAASLPAPCSLPASAPPRPPGAGPGGRRPSAVAGGRGAAGAGRAGAGPSVPRPSPPPQAAASPGWGLSAAGRAAPAPQASLPAVPRRAAWAVPAGSPAAVPEETDRVGLVFFTGEPEASASRRLRPGCGVPHFSVRGSGAGL